MAACLRSLAQPAGCFGAGVGPSSRMAAMPPSAFNMAGYGAGIVPAHSEFSDHRTRGQRRCTPVNIASQSNAGPSSSSSSSTNLASRTSVGSVAVVDHIVSAPPAKPKATPPPSIHPEKLPTAQLESRRNLCDSGMPDVDECILSEPVTELPPFQEAVSRGRWLLGLLIAQSTSSMVLNNYESLLREHIVVTLFLTMLVGAGGNAGNQSAIKVIRALATGSIDVSWVSFKSMMADQVQVALLLGSALSAGGFLRVYFTDGDVTNAGAISLSLFMIVMMSVVLGTGLPFGFAKMGVDPANAGTSIQVLMDIMGVAITCFTCQALLVQYAGTLAT